VPGSNRGAVWILNLNANGTVKTATKIQTGLAGFTPILQNDDWFGWAVGNLGDIDHDGVTDIGVGALQDDSSGQDAGAVWILLMNSNSTVKTAKRIAAGQN